MEAQLQRRVAIGHGLHKQGRGEWRAILEQDLANAIGHSFGHGWPLQDAPNLIGWQLQVAVAHGGCGGCLADCCANNGGFDG